MIDRRGALASVAAMFGTAVFAPIARAAGPAGPVAAVPKISDGPPSAAVFTPAQREAVTVLSERILPTTDTPGAISAGVPAYIEKLLADWSYPKEREPLIAGLTMLEARSQQDYKVPVAKATSAQQDALLTLAMNDQMPGGNAFFLVFRQLVLTGYYTSEIGMTQEREYLPVPGEYNGAFPYSKVNKVYTA